MTFTNRELAESVDSQVHALLSRVVAGHTEVPNEYGHAREVSSPDHWQAVVTPLPPLKPGEIMQITGGIVASDWRETGATFIATLEDLGIETKVDLAENYDGDAKIDIEPKDNLRDIRLYRYAAPWFLRWFVGSSNVPDSVKPLFQYLYSLQDSGSLAFRGEDKWYSSVSSTLYRKMRDLGFETTSGEALTLIYKQLEQEAVRLAPEVNKDDMVAVLQHLGGVTNTIDFSHSPFIALYFAASSGPDGDGRIVVVRHDADSSRLMKMILSDGVHDASQRMATIRMSAQCGTLLSVPAGKLLLSNTTIIDPINNRSVFPSGMPEAGMVNVPSSIKQDVLDVLEKLGINSKSLFPDLVSFARQVFPVPFMESVSVHLISDWIGNRQLDRVVHLLGKCDMDYARAILKSGEGSRGRMALYFIGLVVALRGDIDDGLFCLRKAKEIYERHGKCPRMLRNNILKLRQAKRTGDIEGLHRQLDLSVDESLYTLKLEGYTFRGSW